MRISYKDLARIRKENDGKKMVFCDGTFDLLHSAHIEHLQTTRLFGDVVVVGVMSDEWVRMRKGDKRPILSQEERVLMIDAIKYVDYSFVLYDEEMRERVRTSEALQLLRPDIFVTTDPVWQERAKEFMAQGIELRLVSPTPSSSYMSTSKIIQKILSLGQEEPERL